MRGTITAIAAGKDGQQLARITLEGGQQFEIPYWPELLEQWGPEALRAHLLHQAELASRPAAPLDHSALLGEAEASPVCREGEIGCTKSHEPAAAERSPGTFATVGVL